MEKQDPPNNTELGKESKILLHKVFVDLSLENDLKKEEMEWFRSRICCQKAESESGKKEKVVDIGQIDIITDTVLEKLTERPKSIFLKLSETDTIWFFSLETHFSHADPEDVEKVRRANETYEMKKKKKELIRKRCMADAQTPRYIEKSVGTLTSEINMQNANVLASEWDLYDTYNALDKCEEAPSKTYYKFMGPDAKERLPALPGPEQELSAEERASKMFKTLDFKYAALVTERLLASNCYQSQQSIFKKKFKGRYDDEATLFSYNITPLWNFEIDSPHPLMVTSMDWNPLNQDLLAVGYGDLKFQNSSSGLICVWSPKNPRQPERKFLVDEAVTSVHYSRTRPNLLAVGTRVGTVYVLDVSNQTGSRRTLGSDAYKPRLGPIWKVEWFPYKELTFENEELLAVGESGNLMRFSLLFDKEADDVLKLDYVTTIKKIPQRRSKKQSQRPSLHDESFDKKTFSGLWFSIVSDMNLCLISTKEGVVVKCNMRNPSMNDGVFLAHDGPVYTIEHSPSTDLIYFTCGADWTIKIWMEGLDKPLITLQNKTAVACATWSPTIPTMIASIGDKEVCLWDIARNVLTPMSTRVFDDCEKPFSNVLFSNNGKNLVIGGQDGFVRVVNLSHLPRIPFLQKEALIAAIRRTLLKNNNELLGHFTRLAEANKEKLKTKIVV